MIIPNDLESIWISKNSVKIFLKSGEILTATFPEITLARHLDYAPVIQVIMESPVMQPELDTWHPDCALKLQVAVSARHVIWSSDKTALNDD